MPLFSVVITVFNKDEFINDTIMSVLNQTVEDFELIVLNDGSTDNSEKVILSIKDSRIRYYYQGNEGTGKARNTAIKMATSQHIALLDADDLWETFYLEEQLRLIQKYPNCFVFATAQRIKKNNKSFDLKYSIDNKEDGVFNYFDASHISPILHSSSSVINKEVFDKVGYYQEIKNGQDTDLYIRIGLNYNIAFSPKICSVYNIIKGSLFHSASSLKDKPNFEEYEHIENKKLKKYLDLNRFSLALFAKRLGDKKGFNKLYLKIDKNNLNFTQRILLSTPRIVLISLFLIKNSIEHLGFQFTIFK